MNNLKSRRSFFKYLLIFSSFSLLLHNKFFRNIKLNKSKYLLAKDDKKRNWIIQQSDY